MGKFYKILLLSCFFVVSSLSSYAQTIGFIRFNNSASYTPGSGVSVIINPTGVFDLNNQFVLELSNPGGTFTTPTVLNTLNEFYVPAINGVLPNSLAAGTYKLRVRSTNPVLSVETNSFNVVNGGGIGIPKFRSLLENSGNSSFNCLGENCNNNLINNIFGKINASAGAITSSLLTDNSNALKLRICDVGVNNLFTAMLIDINTSNVINLPINLTNNEFLIPDNLAIGSYVIELEKKNSNNISVFSNIFLFHGNSTNLNNLNDETVCVGNDVDFSIDYSLSGIGRNYKGSKYTIDFGDGSPNETYTQAQLINKITTTGLRHTFNNVSCSVGTSPNIGFFIVQLKLFNKGVYNSGSNNNYCDIYYQNGNGTEKKVNTNRAPIADFNLPIKQCINTTITALNTTVLGQYGTTSCLTTPRYYWYVKKPTDAGFELIDSDNHPSWLVGNDLIIPSNEVNIPGCWEIKLEAKNFGAGCQTITVKIKTIKIEAIPTPTFTNSPQSPICAGTSILFTNTSNVLNLPCQEPTYSWTVTPVAGTPATSSGYQFVAPTDASSQNANILFTQPGSYSVVLNVTNSCGTFPSTPRIIEVFGDPTVSFNPNTLTICDAAPAGYTIDFSQVGTTPTYSVVPFAPTNFTWTVSGPGVTPADYSFVGGTNANSQYPKINFTAYKTYIITVQVNGNCAGSNQASFTFILKEMPVITNTNLTQTICTGGTTSPINLASSMASGTVFNWVVTATNGITGFTTPGTGNIIPGVTLINPSNTSGTVTYTVTPSNNGCIGTPINFVITVNPTPLVPAQAITTCSGNAFTVSLSNNPPSVILPLGTTFTWTVTSPGGITGASNQTTPVSSIGQTLVNTTNAPIDVIYTITASTGSASSICTSNFTLTVTVNPRPQIPNQTLSVCSGTAFNLSLSNNPPSIILPSGTTYTWTVTAPAGITGASNQNTPISNIGQTLLNSTSNPINVVYNITATSGSGSSACTNNFTLTVTVNPSPAVNFSPTNQTICSGETSALVTLSSATPGATFSWTAVQPAGITGVITSGTNTIPAQNLVNSTNAPITIIYVAVAATTGGNTCAGSTYNYTITVNPKPSITENFAEAICSGGSFSITPSNSTLNSIPTGTTYSWSAPIVTGGITGGTSATNQTSISGTLVNPTNIVQTATYTVTPRANGCAGNTFTVVISVNPKPVIANVTHPAICSETAFTITPANGSGNIVPTGTTYTWTISNNSNITGASASSTPGITTISQTLTNTTNTAQTIVYTVTPTSGDVGNCVGSTFTITVVVNPKPLVQATTQAICSATAFTVTPTNGSGNIVPNTTTYTWTTPVSTPAGAITGGSAQTTGVNTISQTLTNTTTEVATIEYTVTPMAGACAGIPFIITITVNPTPTTLSLTNQTYCNGVSTTEIAFTNAVAGTTYTWTNSNTSIGLAASGTGNIPVFTPTNGGTAPIIANISVIATANGCSRVAETFTITVNPSPVVTFSPTNQTICSGETSALVNLSSTTPGATFSWTATQPTGITGVATSGTNTIPAQTLVNTTNAPIDVNYTAVAATTGGNTCAGSTYNYTITVNPKPSITESFAEAICSGESFSITPSNSTLNSIPTGTTYSWSAPIVTGGITGGTSATNQTSISGTLVNPTNIVQTATYTVTPRANGCAGNTFTVVISVNPKPVIANVTHPAICSETAFTITPANGSGNIVPAGTTYTWTVNNNTNITGASDSNVAGISTISQTLTNSSNTTQTIVYTVTPTSGDTGNCVGDTFTITVVVNPKPFIQNSTQTICSGTAFDATPTNGSGNIVPNTTTYTWTTPVSTPAGAITGGSAQTTGVNTISQTLTNTTTEVATIEYTVTPMAGACAGIPFIITITVNPTPTTLSLTNQTYCNGVSTTEIAFTNAVAGTTYTWTNSNTSIGLAASGTGNIPVFTPTNGGTAPIIANISVIATANGCSRVAETFTITVNPSPVVTFSPTNQTICSGETSALVNLSSTTPGATFSWTATQPTGITGVATSGTNTIPAQTLVNTTNAPIDVNYTAVAATTGGNTCAGSTYNYTITVNPKPSITESFAEAICSGESFSITPSNSTLNSIPTGTTYSWSAPIVTGGITGGTSATNQTSISGTLVNPTNIVQTATYTVTPRANGCAGNTFTVVISVNPKPVIANVTHPAICSETAFTITPANGSGNIVPAGTTYTWTVNNNTNITGASDSNVAGISTISQTLTNSSNTTQTIVYTVTPTSGDTGNCVGDTFTITVVVNPKPFIQNSTQTICSGTAFDATPTNGSGNIVPNTTTYTWTTPVSTPAGAITGGSAQTTGVNTISQTLTNTTTEVATIEYTVTPMAGACAGIPFIITITVNPTPTTLSLTNQTYCNGVSTTEIAFTNAVAGTTYTWTNSNTAIGLAASGTGNIPVFTPTNGGTAPIIANISVIATANGCSRVAETFTITVNPSPVVTFSPTNQTICSGETSALVNLSSTTPGATFSWTATQPTGITGVATSGTNTIPAQTLVNTTNAPIDVNYTAVAATNDTSACAGSSFTYTITVNPKPSIENQSFIICSEEGFTVDPIDGIPNTNTIVPLGTTYNWVISNNPNISGASSGTGSQISQVLTNNSTLIQTIVYTVTPIAGICTGNPFTITIEVYPRPDVTFDIPIQTICNETNTSLVTLNSTLPGNITYEWNATIPSGITGALSSGTNTIPVQTLINTTNAPLTITYAATATFNNNGSSCEGNVYNYSITVNPTFTSSGVVSNYNGYNVSVFGGNDGAINLTTIGGSGTYTYNWTGPNGFTSTAEDISGLFAGTYTVTINDGYCAPIVLTFTLTQPPELLIQSDLSLTINLICFGDNNGAVGVLITQESVPPYDYELYDSNGNLVTSIIDSTNLNPQFTGLVAGVYSLTVIDANGGRKTVTGLTVSQPDDIIITATTTPITCYGANNASITLTVTGGTGPYQAQWDNLATGFYQNNLAAGDYTILVTDSNGCTKTIVVNIPEAPIFTINPVVVNISCYGANDGSINLNLVGGIQPISLTWSDGSTAGLVRNNLAPGTYTVTIVDSKPCTIVRTFIIVEPQPLVLSANVQNALDCNNANSGSINLLVSGGTPPFTYSWSNGATTEDLNTISSGNYAVLVTDSRGCTKSAQYSVNRPQPLTLNVETDTNVNCETRDIRQIFEAQVSGGLPPIQLSWSSGTVSGSNNEFMTTDQDGLVILTATDALGCTTTYSLNVDIPVLGNASFDQTSYGYTAYGIYSILDPIQFTNTATGDYVSILWNFGDGTFSNEENPIHTYVQEGDYVVTQTVTYPFGCVYVHTISLLVEKGYLLVVPTAFTPNNDSLNDTYRPVTKGLKDVRLDVFDTWGSLIYSETGDVLRGWDGTINGVKSENGNYNCKVTAETFYGKIITVEETFVLIK